MSPIHPPSSPWSPSKTLVFKYTLGAVNRFPVESVDRVFTKIQFVKHNGRLLQSKRMFPALRLRKSVMTFGRSLNPSASVVYVAAINDFAAMVKRDKPLADAATFTRDIINSKDSLIGIKGEALEKERKSKESGSILYSSRTDLVRDLGKGRIAYSETPLGACMSTKHCNRRPTLTVSNCLGCDSAVIRPSLLNQAIDALEKNVPKIDRTSNDDFEWRNERAELESLKRFRRASEKKGRE